MKYTQKSFTVPASAGSAEYCAEHGHTMPDVLGKCVRCGYAVQIGTYIRDNIMTTTAEAPVLGHKTSQ